MRVFLRYSTFIALAGLITSGVAAAPSILPPPAGINSEITNFERQWCAPVSSASLNSVRELCFGHTKFHLALGVRAVVLVSLTGYQVYLEREFGGVDLLRLTFDVIGPINDPTTVSEVGHVRLRVDAQGEVDAVAITTPFWGEIRAFRNP